MFDRLIKYLKEDIWKISAETLSFRQAFKIRFLRVFVLTAKGLTKSQIQKGASILTYYSLLSLVPMLALLIGIARGFSLEDNLHQVLLARFSNQAEVLNKLFEFARSSLQQTARGVIEGLGVILLAWSTIKILKNIESVMNEIWEVTRSRTIAKQFSDYLALLVICPLIMFISSGVTVYLTARITAIVQKSALLTEVSPVLFFLLNLVPYLLTSGLFTFIYIFMPNTYVRFKPALYAGLIAGLLYQIFQGVYIYFQVGVSSYNAIYGTFAAVPLFLIWMQLSWVLFLVGAKLAFAFQNVTAYEFITEDFRLSHRAKNLLSLRIVHFAICRFCEGKEPLTAAEFSRILSIPLMLTHQLLHELLGAQVISETKRTEEEEMCYQPARDVDQLTIKWVLGRIEAHGESIPFPQTKESKLLEHTLATFDSLIEKSDANRLLKDIACDGRTK